MQNNEILTQRQAADILRINERTLMALAVTGQIPHIRMSPNSAGVPQFRFNSQELSDWLRIGPVLFMVDQLYVEHLKRRFQKNYPVALASLQEYNKHFVAPREPKGYSLSKIPNKKLGFVYHVRYIEQGKLIPSRWSTHTNNEAAAIEFAITNRDRLIAEYIQRKASGKLLGSLYKITKKYYEKDSPYLEQDVLRGRALGEKRRYVCHTVIMRHWVPFLRKQRVSTVDGIDIPLLVRFQDYCLDQGLKPQTINGYVSAISRIFDYLVLRGYAKANPCDGLVALHVGEDDLTVRGCYNVDELKGVFNRRWRDEMSFLLCMVIYATGMRNSEIELIQVKDIIERYGCHFIDVPKSKTRYGARIVPLHDFVHGRLRKYIKAQRKAPDDLLFCQKNDKPLSEARYTAANIALGAFTGRDEAMLEQEHITFYSGRHFWKTLMNSRDLGDIEEVFMGHKVTKDVAKLYNHRDKQGQEKIVSKAKEVFAILDEKLFT